MSDSEILAHILAVLMVLAAIGGLILAKLYADR